MADFKIKATMKVRVLKANFKKAFGATLRVYDHGHLVTTDVTIGSIRAAGSRGGELSVAGNTLVSTFENKMKENYGITVQVANADNTKLASNSITLSAAGK